MRRRLRAAESALARIEISRRPNAQGRLTVIVPAAMRPTINFRLLARALGLPYAHDKSAKTGGAF
jgi:hypothetical protein